MQLDTFLGALARRQAQQAVLVSGQPMRVLIGGEWKPGAATPSDALLNAMLQSAAPGVNLLENRFDTSAAGENFVVRVTSRNGARILVFTRLDTGGQPLAAEETAISAFAPQIATDKPDAFDRARGAAPFQSIQPLAPLVQNEIFAPPIATPPLPLAVTGQWYHAARGTKVGPMTLETMQQLIQTNIVRPETMVWQEGMGDWAMAKLTDLSSLFAVLPPSLPNNTLSGHGAYGSSNSSGTGWDASVPKEVLGGKLNAGAFFLTLFWCIAHGVWYLGVASMVVGALLGMLIPGAAFILGAVGPLIISIYGNRIAWQNRSFKDLEEFNAVQRAWGWAGFCVFLGFVFIGFWGVNSSSS